MHIMYITDHFSLSGDFIFIAMSDTLCSVCLRIALVFLLSTTHAIWRCASQSPFYDDGGSSRTLCACNNWCQEEWDGNRLLRYNYTVTKRTVIKSVAVTKNDYDCTTAKTSQGCIPSGTARTFVQIPVSVESWSRTGPIVETTSQELSMGLLRTDNIGVWGNYISQTYPLNQDKIWQIAIPQTEQGSCRFVIYFNEFDVEQSPNCEKDYFSVQVTKFQGDIPKYCTVVSRIEVRNRKKLQLWMHSDNTAARKGIHAIYCFSNWPAAPSDLPCSCGSNRMRRETYGSPDLVLRRLESTLHTAEGSEDNQLIQPSNAQHLEDSEIHHWLKDMLTHGEQRISMYLKSTDTRQQHIAQRLVEAIDSHQEKQPITN